MANSRLTQVASSDGARAGGAYPLPAPVTMPPKLTMPPDTLITGEVHAAEHDAADVLDFFGKVPFLRDIGYKVYGIVAGKPKDSPIVDNLGALSSTLYRGAQPSQQGFRTLARDGIKTVINLRPEEQWEKPMVQAAGMKYVFLPLPPLGEPTMQQATRFLGIVTDPAAGKVFFHCQHGSDRTGAMAAAYRIAVDGWSADQAIAEMPRYHLHQGLEDDKITFVRQFAVYWSALPASTRAGILHGIKTEPLAPVTAATGAAGGAAQALPPREAEAPVPAGAKDPGGAVAYSGGNSVKLFVDRKNTVPEALKLINGARQSIQFETFTFNGHNGLEVADALVAARARGVNVQVVLDPKQLLVSNGMGMKDFLQSHGVDVRVYQQGDLHDPVVAIDHAKQLIVDGKTALVGDSNFDRYEDYDLDYEVQGPAVPELQAMFAQSWNNAHVTGTLVSSGLPQVKPVPVAVGTPVSGGDTQIGITETAPKDDPKVAQQTYQDTLAAIQHATKSIDVLMYTMSQPDELAALIAAHDRGVAVRVIMSPSKEAYDILAAEKLRAAGIPVHWFKLAPGMKEMHAKVAVFDGQTVLGGSTNWVHSSAFDNHELGVWMKGAVAGQVEKVFDHDWASGSTPAKPLTLLQKAEAQIMRVVSRFL